MKKTFFSFFMYLGITSTHFCTPATAHTISQLPQLEKFYSHCDTLTVIIQDMAQKISADTLKTCSSFAYIKWLNDLNILIAQLSAAAAKAKTEADLYSLFAQHTIITNIIYQAFQNSFKQIPVALNQKKLTPAACNLCAKEPHLASIIQKNTALLNIIPLIMKKHGRTNLNYAYTKISNLIQENPTTLKLAILLGACFTGSKLKKSCPRLDIPQVIIDTSSVQSPTGLLWTMQRYISGNGLKTGIKWTIAAGCVMQRMVNPRRFIMQTKKQLSELHKYLLGEGKNKFTRTRLSNKIVTSEEIPLTEDSHSEMIHEMIDYLINMQKYQDAGIFRPKSWLFTGKAGNGKTVMAHQIKNYIKEKNIKCSFVEVTEDASHHNDLAQAITYAQRAAPCIIFVDEIHLAGYGLQANGDKQLLNNMLRLLQELNSNNKQVIFIAATNRPDLIDPALTRDGRLKEVRFQDPTFEERKKMLLDLCKQSALDSASLDLDQIAYLTANCSKSTINTLFKTAAFKARQKNESLGQNHLYEALNVVVRKLQPPHNLSHKERAIVAAHQAGTALLHVILQPAAALESVTILATPQKIREVAIHEAQKTNSESNYELNYGAIFTCSNNELFNPNDTEEQIKQCKLTIAGIEAQKLLIGSATTYNHDASHQAYQLIIAMLSNNIPLVELAKKDQEHIKEHAQTLLKEYQEEVNALLEIHKNELAALAKALQEKTFLTRPEIDAIIAQKTA